jgi:hypothetical protein
MSYYKYKERDEASRVNWNAISSDVVKTLKEQEAAREKSRQEIEKNTRESLEQIADAPQGENKSANQWILGASADSSEYLMMLNRQLKAGLLDPRDYTLARQNLEDSYGHLKAIAQKAQEESSITIQGINDGTLIAGLTGAVQGDLDSFQKWNETKAYINPNTGVMSIGKVGADGKLLDGASNFTTLEGFANQMRVRFDRWDYASDLQDKTDALGKQIELDFQRDPRGYESFEDFKRKFGSTAEFNEYLDKTIQAINSSDIKKISVLEEMGGYNVEYDLNATKTTVEGNTIKVGFKTNNDGTKFPVLDENGLIKRVTDGYLKLQFRSMLDYEEGFQKVASDETAAEVKARVDAGAGAKEEDTYVTTIAQLYTGDENEKRKAAQSILNLQPGGRNISNVNVTDRGVVFEYTENGQPATQEFSFYDDNGNLMSQADFIESMGTFGGITSIDEALSRGRFNRDAQFSDAQTSVSETARQRESPLEAFERIVTGPEYQFDATLFVEDNEDATKENLQKLISSIPGSKGYSVEAIGGVLSDAIAVNDSEGNRIAELDLNDPLTDSSGNMRREVQAFIDAITGSIIGNVDKDVLEQVTSGQLQMKGAGSGGGMGGF